MQDNILKIYSPDKRWRAEISARLGANITKLQFDDNDVLVPLKSKNQLEENPFIIGSPLLFPANRTYKGEFEFQGEKYSLPVNDSLKVANLHGFLYSMQFDIIEIGSNKVILSYENKGEIYPFKFKIIVEYSLVDIGINQTYSIKNTGNIDMPFTFALHTTFVEPQKFNVPISKCQEKNEQHIPTGKYIELNQQEKNYSAGSISKGIAISGYYKSCGNSALIGQYKYTVSNNFDHWILYNGAGKSGFICIEPQCGAVNGLNIKDGHKVLKPSCSETFITQISNCF